MVWRRHGWAPKFMHNSREEAVAEAERLSTGNPDALFFILESVESIGRGTELPIPKAKRKEKIAAEKKTQPKANRPKSLTIADIMRQRTA